MEITLRIRRQGESARAEYKNYTLDVDPGTTVLDALNRVKWELDGTLAFRKNCRNAICGSCAMRINGRSALACASRIRDVVDERGEILVQPMGNMPVVKDLVVDMSDFWKHLDQVDPYVDARARHLGKESLQTPAQREVVEQASNCILCGACYSECNSREVNPNFVGPHALARAWRVLKDNRDRAGVRRREQLNGNNTAWGCTRCFYCNEVCPMGVQPLEQIQKIRHEVLTDEAATDNTAIRHRRAMVRQIRESGWLDEARFALQVVGRDVQGLIRLVPLGTRMVLKGKVPLRHRPIAGRAELVALIDEIQTTEKP